jgi:benzoate membrane transport protein
MRAVSLTFPAVLSGFVAVLVGYASSAAIIWQAAAAAGATPEQIAGWMTALGIGWWDCGLLFAARSWRGWHRCPSAKTP